MNRCLQTPEILRLICDELPTGRRSERQRVLAVALSCRAFLGPALDRLWNRVHSFEIFRCTIPSDVWELETIRVKDKDRPEDIEDKYKYELLDLRRAITAEDLERYLRYYAPRIRAVHIRDIGLTLSPAAWHSLHLAVNWQPGALAPYATEIKWPLTPLEENLIPPDVLNQAWPYYILFMSSNTTSLDFAFRSDSPIQVASLRNAAQHPNLQRLRMEDQSSGVLEGSDGDDDKTVFTDKYIQSFQWSHLQALDLGSLTGDSLDHLSTLPSLKSLKIDELGDVNLHHEYLPSDYTRRPGYISDLPPDAFASLEILDLFAENITSLTGFLQRIPATNQIHTLKCGMDDAMYQQEGLRALAVTIKHHCNRERLRHLEMRDEVCQYNWEEDSETGVDPVVDITLFFEFGNLENVIFSLSENISLTSENINRIVTSWPKLVELDIDVGFPTSRPPRIDHNDCSTLLYGCPRLERLGLYFDATRIADADPTSLPLVRSNRGPKPASLLHLHVGISPILSTKPMNFLRIHCPSLFQGRDRLVSTGASDIRPEVFNRKYAARWHVVATEITMEYINLYQYR